MDLLKDLNDVQQQAVQQYDGPTLVIAGAGSGKTRVLTYRIAYLLQQGVRPYHILALTFTNKAAREMRERIGRLIGEETASRLWMGTFHSIFARILRRESESLQYPSTFTIYDAQDSRNLVKQIVKEMELDSKLYTPKVIASRISAAKNNLMTVEAYAGNSAIRQDDTLNRRPRTAEIYEKYAARCRKSAVMDFDDLLLNTNILFRDFPAVLDKYQQQFRYILVDEYQDTNHAQYLIVKKLAQQHHNLCVVGDDSQSIYAFRGAQIENILNFKKDYPEYRLCKLEQNYRSTRTIVKAANTLIEKNSQRIPKEVWSDNETGEKIKVLHAANDLEESSMVVESVRDMLYSERIPYRETAVLYRTHAQSRLFEEALRRVNIPYVVYGGQSFYQRKEVKDVLAYLRLLVNPHDDEAFRRVVNYPIRGIGDTSVEHLAEAADAHDTSLWEAALHAAEWTPALRCAKSLATFIGMMQELAAGCSTENAYNLALRTVNQSGILTLLREEQVPENISRIENIEELLNGIKTFTSDNANDEHTVLLSDYLENVALLTDMDSDTGNEDHVTLMTVHSAKGLEFDAIFVVGMEDGLFPSEMGSQSLKDLEEERRLFYVAMTRARKRLFLSYADTRMRNGETAFGTLSRFVREVDPQYLDMPEDAGIRFKENRQATGGFRPAGRSVPYGQKSYYGPDGPFGRQSAAQRTTATPMTRPAERPAPAAVIEDFTPDAPESIQTGMQVLHKAFGKGEVLSIEGTGPNRKATVRFDSGMKQLLLKFARLKILQVICLMLSCLAGIPSLYAATGRMAWTTSGASGHQLTQYERSVDGRNLRDTIYLYNTDQMAGVTFCATTDSLSDWSWWHMDGAVPATAPFLEETGTQSSSAGPLSSGGYRLVLQTTLRDTVCRDTAYVWIMANPGFTFRLEHNAAGQTIRGQQCAWVDLYLDPAFPVEAASLSYADPVTGRTFEARTTLSFTTRAGTNEAAACQFFSDPGGQYLRTADIYAVEARYTATATDGCGHTQQDVVTVMPHAVTADFSLQAVSDRSGKNSAPLEVNLTNNSLNATQFVWEFGDGTTFGTDQSTPLSHTYTSPKTYTVSLTSSNNWGCEAGATQQVTVDAADLRTANVFTPNNDGQNDYFLPYNVSIRSFTIHIYTRSGKLVFSHSGSDMRNWEGWDGRTNQGQEASEGVYYYVMEAKGYGRKQTFQAENYTGFVYLYR